MSFEGRSFDEMNNMINVLLAQLKKMKATYLLNDAETHKAIKMRYDELVDIVQNGIHTEEQKTLGQAICAIALSHFNMEELRLNDKTGILSNDEPDDLDDLLQIPDFPPEDLDSL